MPSKLNISILGFRILGLILFLKSLIYLGLGLSRSGLNSSSVIANITTLILAVYLLIDGKYVAKKAKKFIPHNCTSSLFLFMLTIVRFTGFFLILKSIASIILLVRQIIWHLNSINGQYMEWIQELAMATSILVTYCLCFYLIKRGEWLAKVLLFIPQKLKINVYDEKITNESIFPISMTIISLKFIITSLGILLYLILYLTQTDTTGNENQLITNASCFTLSQGIFTKIPVLLLTLFFIFLTKKAWSTIAKNKSEETLLSISSITKQLLKTFVIACTGLALTRLVQSLCSYLSISALNRNIKDFLYFSNMLKLSAIISIIFAAYLFVVSYHIKNKQQFVANLLTKGIEE
ncbi:MAG: hypothetical protein ACIAQZ_13235 [Sedimentisphaeraceae bacterium JB056]